MPPPPSGGKGDKSPILFLFHIVGALPVVKPNLKSGSRDLSLYKFNYNGFDTPDYCTRKGKHFIFAPALMVYEIPCSAFLFCFATLSSPFMDTIHFYYLLGLYKGAFSFNRRQL